MLVIRDAQIEELRQASLAALRARLRRQLRADAGVSPPGEHRIDALIERTFADARRFGLSRESDLLRFATILGVFCGPDVSRPLPVQALQILLNYGADPALKLDRFDSWTLGAPCELEL